MIDAIRSGAVPIGGFVAFVPGQLIEAHGHQFRYVAAPAYDEAHPGEGEHPGELCTRCAIAERTDTGERVLLWLCGDLNWSISRADPNAERHRAELLPFDFGATPDTEQVG